jgi:hypothetical protein
MTHPESFLVTPTNGPRPAGPPDKCFYCGRGIGEPHVDDCVCRRKTVVLRGSFELTVIVPEDWDAEDTLFWANEGASCTDNHLNQLVRLSKKQGCSCGRLSFELARDATAEDEARDGVTVGSSL